MASPTLVRARVDERVKEAASKVLAEHGLSFSDVVRMALTRVVEDGAVPVELKVPNAETQAAIRESRD